MTQIDYAGRIEFLNAGEHIKWRGKTQPPLKALAADVLPRYRHLVMLAGQAAAAGREAVTGPLVVSGKGTAQGEQGRAARRLAATLVTEVHAPLAALRTNPRPEVVEIVSALDRWMARYQFCPEDEWIAEAAHETARWAVSTNSGRLKWRAPHPLMQPPQPILPVWGYGYDAAGAFQRHAQEYRKQARASLDYLVGLYLQEVRSQITGTQHPSTPEHARWTALRCSGLTYAGIVEYERKDKRGMLAARQVIQRAVTAFARRIDFTLPGSD